MVVVIVGYLFLLKGRALLLTYMKLDHPASINTFLPSNLNPMKEIRIRYSSKDFSNEEFRNVFVRKERHSVYISFVIYD